MVGRSISRFWQYVGLNGGGSIWFLARTAGRTWASCCSGRTVRNSESLRGLRDTLQGRRGRVRLWQLGRVVSGELVTKTEPCLSVTDQVKGLRPWLRFAEIERTSRGKARALSCHLAVRTYRTGAKALPCQSSADDGYGWVVPKPCGRWPWLGRAKAVRTMTMAGSRQSRADRPGGRG